MKLQLTLLKLVLIIVFIAPQPASGEGKGSYRSNSGFWDSDEFSRTETLKITKIKGYSKRLDADTLQAIHVEWQQPKFDRLGNNCTFRGKLFFVDKTSNEQRPVNWLQGLTLYVARNPELTPDWSNGMDSIDTAYARALTSADGQFSFQLKLQYLQTDRSRPQDYQVGIALAEHKVTGKSSQTVIWKPAFPAVHSTVQKLTLPAAEKISHELYLVNQARDWPFKNPNGAVFIRAVNALQRSGKENALQTLEEYLEYSEFVVWGNNDVVFWIIRVLFEPINLDDRIPIPLNYVSFYGGVDYFEKDYWPLNPMVVVDDVPFMLGSRHGGSGQPEQPTSHIQWARRFGVIRDRPLKPSSNPLVAIESLLQSQRFLQLSEELQQLNEKFGHDGGVWKMEFMNDVRTQAIEMLDGQLDPIGHHDYDDGKRDKDWNERLKESKRLNIHWDTAKEEFTISDK